MLRPAVSWGLFESQHGKLTPPVKPTCTIGYVAPIAIEEPIAPPIASTTASRISLYHGDAAPSLVIKDELSCTGRACDHD